MTSIENKIRKEDDCLICFDHVSTEKTHIKCTTCNKLYHHRCFRIWICRFKKEKVMACPYCQQDSILLNTIQTELCSCCFPIFFPNKKKIIIKTEKLALTSNNPHTPHNTPHNTPRNNLRDRAGTI